MKTEDFDDTKPDDSFTEDTKSSSPSLFDTISWLDEDDEMPDTTIPAPIRRMTTGEDDLSVAQQATQAQLIRWGFVGADRALTHWGRGVMNKPEWEIRRHPQDYDALEAATAHLMQAHGLSINLSPEIVFVTVVGAAYVPPVSYIARHTDATRSGRIFSGIKSFITYPLRLFRRRRPEPVAVES